MDLTVRDRRVYLTTSGLALDTALPFIVFIHGAGMEQSAWALQARFFAYHDFNALAPNLPGHGPCTNGGGPAHSDGPALASVAEIADWLPDLLDAAGAETAVLVGHSMGALAALDCAARHPGRVAKLALLGAAAKMPVHPGLLEAAEKGERLAHELVAAWGHGPSGHYGGSRAPGLWMMGNALRILDRAPKGVLHTDLVACNAYETGLESAAKVTCPTLVLAGHADRMAPPKASAALAEAIPDAELVVLPGSGHMMMAEKPDSTLDALANFLT